MFAGVIFVATFIHFPTFNGYIHIGDAFIYLAACFLPTPFAVGAAGIGAALADITSGYAIWAVPTVIIKSLLVLSFTSKKDIMCKQNVFACITGIFITTIGYYVAEGILYGNFITPIFSSYMNAIQGIASMIVFIFIGLLINKSNLKGKI